MFTIAKFFSNSQPIAPAPITKVLSYSILLAADWPTTILIFLNSSSFLIVNFYTSSSL